MSGPEDDQFLPKTPVKFKSQQSKQAKELAVDVRNISYQYGHGRKANKVLNDVTLKVPLGGIYGLLGPSGCGTVSSLVWFSLTSLFRVSLFILTFRSASFAFHFNLPFCEFRFF